MRSVNNTRRRRCSATKVIPIAFPNFSDQCTSVISFSMKAFQNDTHVIKKFMNCCTGSPFI